MVKFENCLSELRSRRGVSAANQARISWLKLENGRHCLVSTVDFRDPDNLRAHPPLPDQRTPNACVRTRVLLQCSHRGVNRSCMLHWQRHVGFSCFVRRASLTCRRLRLGLVPPDTTYACGPYGRVRSRDHSGLERQARLNRRIICIHACPIAIKAHTSALAAHT